MDELPDASCAPRGGYRALISNFPNGVLVLFDADLRYRIVGPEVLPFSKREASEMVGKTVYKLFPEATADEVEPVLRATIDGERRSVDIEYDGRVHHLETKPVRIDGNPYGILVTQAVTEERRTARDLRRQNERLDQFASMVSHDLRNPLSIALGELTLYRETGDESKLDAIERALDRIDELTTDLLTLVRADSTSDDHAPASIARLARDAWSMTDTRSATLEVEDCTVVGDASQLQALFENLFRNAVGHGGEDVTVRVGPSETGFFVEDTGDGIPPDVREKVFEHGFSTGYSGTGVGLAIVDRIARSHGWDVTLAESPEGGARFEFQGADGDAQRDATREP